MEDIKIGDQFEDLEKRHRGKVRIVEVVSPDAGAGRALCKVIIDGKDRGREVFIQRRRLLNNHKAKTYLRVRPGKSLIDTARALLDPKSLASLEAMAKEKPRTHSLDSKKVGPLDREETAALEEHMRRWPATHYHKRLMMTLRQLETALQITLEDRNNLEALLDDISKRASNSRRTDHRATSPLSHLLSPFGAPGTVG